MKKNINIVLIYSSVKSKKSPPLMKKFLNKFLYNRLSNLKNSDKKILIKYKKDIDEIIIMVHKKEFIIVLITLFVY